MAEAIPQDIEAANGATAIKNGAEEARIDTSADPGTENTEKESVQVPTAKSSEAETKTEEPTPTADSKKRKHSPAQADERDWRVRRDQDNGRDRGRGFAGGRGRGPNYRGGRGGGGNRGGGKFVDYRDNIKSQYALPESSDPDEIRKQVEFYFSDSNLPTDKFLLEKTGGSANNPVPISVIHSFKRMRHFQPYSAIVEALRESEVLNISDKEEITRKEALPSGLGLEPEKNIAIFEDKTRSRSIYAKGFGEEGPSTQFDIEAFFAPYGPINAIRLRRRFPEKIFKGSVFVEFDTDETAKQFLALENKPKWDGRDLLIMSKDDYVRGKAKDIEEGKIRPNSIWRGPGRRRGHSGRDRGGGRDSRGRRDDRGSRRRRDENQGDEESSTKPNDAKAAPQADADGTREEGQGQADEKEVAADGPSKDADASIKDEAPAPVAAGQDAANGEEAGESSKKRAREADEADGGDAVGMAEESETKKIRSQ